jgi:hypothetical protein
VGVTTYGLSAVLGWESWRGEGEPGMVSREGRGEFAAEGEGGGFSLKEGGGEPASDDDDEEEEEEEETLRRERRV